MKLFPRFGLLIISSLLILAALPTFAQTNCVYDNGPHACILGPAGDVFVYDLSGNGIITFSNADGSVTYGTYALRSELDNTVGAPGPIAVPFGTFGPFALYITVAQNGDVSYRVDYVSGDVAISTAPPLPHIPSAGAGNIPPPPATNPGLRILPNEGLWLTLVDNASAACVIVDNGGDPGFAEFQRLLLELIFIDATSDFLEDAFLGVQFIFIDLNGRRLVFDDFGVPVNPANPSQFTDSGVDSDDPEVILTWALAINTDSPEQLSIATIITTDSITSGVAISCEYTANFVSLFLG